ncbi:hypothetical protein M878_16300 [Streptomyces roseochromogenus subsp. oscitans DS 12.976]|uniref:Uncharacterized protein n=1 Tax=Streptomyces roseochromogenus subsp. oscitans DS 12.976 TaxID=1352936 RepID=V6KRF7_STRRC|nr:hypothetical protein M878_16300 [Streptomyces roseochromogenus subsp. oscitans DS 12.976]
MRSLLAAILSLFLPPRGAHRAHTSPHLAFSPPVPVYSPAPARWPRPCPSDVIAADGLPLVRPYLAVWERERDEHDRWRLQRERRRAAVLAALGQDYAPQEAAA